MARRILLGLGCLLGAPFLVLGQGTTSWTNFSNADNSWLNPTNWNNGVASGTLTALINSGSAPVSYEVNHDSGTNEVLSVRLGLSTTRTATLNIDAGTMLNVVGPGGGDLNFDTVQMGNGARLNVDGTMIVAGGIFAQGNSIINVNGGVLVDSNRLTRLNNTARMNITGGGLFIDTSAMDLAGAGGAEDARLNIMNGAAQVTGLNAGFRGTGVVAIGASGALTNLGNSLVLGGPPPSGSHAGRGFLYSTGTVYNTGSFILGDNTTNDNAFGMAVISGGTFEQVGDSSKVVRVGDRNKGYLTVEGGAFLSTNNMTLGNQNRSIPARNQRGDGTVIVTGTGQLAVTNAGGTATITLGTTSAVPDADRGIGQMTVEAGSARADVLTINNGVYTNAGGTTSLGRLNMGNSAGAASYIQSGGTSLITGVANSALVLGGTGAAKALNVEGGLLLVDRGNAAAGGDSIGTNATINVSGGILRYTAPTNSIGGFTPPLTINNSATVNVSGGALEVVDVTRHPTNANGRARFVLGGSGAGTMNITGGNVLFSNIGDGIFFGGLSGTGLGQINQSGGTNTIGAAGGNVYIGGTTGSGGKGEYNLSGGLLDSAKSIELGNGSAAAFSEANPLGVLNISGDGVFRNSGSTVLGGNDWGGAANSGNGHGVVNISGGTADFVGSLLVGTATATTTPGNTNRGYLTMTGGDANVSGGFRVGDISNAYGRVSMGGGTLDVTAGDFFVGRRGGAGEFLQTNGTVVSLVNVSVADGTDSVGLLRLDGGSFTVTNAAGNNRLLIGNGGGQGTLQLGGGALTVDQIVIAANSLMVGAGAITGSLTNFGTIAPGNSPGIIAVDGDAVLADTSLLLMELAGTGAGDFDQFNVTGMLGFDGTLTVTLTNGFAPQVGDVFDLFDFGSTNGLAFDAVNLPDLVNAAWDTTDLYLGGSIAVVIPEPGTFALLGIGAALLAAARRRRHSS